MVQLLAAAAELPLLTGATAQADARAATTLELLDFEVIAYNSFGGTVDAPDADYGSCLVAATPADGKSFTMQLGQVDVPDAATLDATDITRVSGLYTETCV